MQNHSSAICNFYLLYILRWQIFPSVFPGFTCTTLAALFLYRSWRFGTGLFWPSQPTTINTFNWSLRIVVVVVVVESFLSLLICWNPFFFPAWSRLHQPLSWFHGSQKKHDKSAGAFSWLKKILKIFELYLHSLAMQSRKPRVFTTKCLFCSGLSALAWQQAYVEWAGL